MFQQIFTFRHGSRTFPRDKKFFFGRREQRTASYRYRPRRRTLFHFIEFPHAQIRIYLTRQIFDSTKTYFHRSLSRHENHIPLPGAPEISRLGCVNLSTTWTRGKVLDTGDRGRMSPHVTYPENRNAGFLIRNAIWSHPYLAYWSTAARFIVTDKQILQDLIFTLHSRL